MASALICGGILLLTLAGMGTQRKRLWRGCSAIRQLLYLDRIMQRILRQLRALPLPQADAPLQSVRQEVTHLQQHRQILAALPGGEDCLPRMLSLARTLAIDDSPAPDTMLSALLSSEIPCTPAEIAAFPLAVAVAFTEMLHQALHAYHVGNLDGAELNELLWQHTERFSTLRLMPWLEQGEQADLLHALLLTDPSATYPRMTAASRLALRLDAERFARHAHRPASDVVRQALALCHAAGPQALETYVGYWLQDAQGMAQLHRSLGGRAGWLYARVAARRTLCRYILRSVAGVIAGFAFLQEGHPVFMLPFFSICAGSVVRGVLRLRPEVPLPTMSPDSSDTSFRTLVILPAQLEDQYDAARQVERFRQVSRIGGDAEADFLLLGDLHAHITAIGGQDDMVAAGALNALSTLNDSRFLYLQRGRVWNDAAHIYSCRGGICGALQEVCRLIVRGETVDAITCSTIDLADFERRYAYLLVLPGNIMPGPDMLEKMLGAASHPMNIRYPSHRGWRGYAVLSPENCDADAGCWLLRPDAFLEATEDYLSASADEELLCSELAGHASVRDALAEDMRPSATWEAMLHRSADAWRLLRWQFPWVRTPVGMIRNPLDFFARFHLRDRLREAALPVARIVLLLWALLTRSWPLLTLALLSPMRSPLAGDMREWLSRLLALPTQSAISTAGMLSPWFPRLAKLPAGFVLELWAQWIAASVLIGLAIALPGMRIPALLLAAGFAALPLIPRRRR